MIGIIIGIGALLLGAKGFSAQGLPFTSKKRLTGTTGMIVGAVCMLIGLLFIVEGLFGFGFRSR